MLRQVPGNPVASSGPASVAFAVGLFFMLGTVTQALAQEEKIVIAPGESRTHQLSGDRYRQLTAVKVLRGDRETRDISASLGRADRRGRAMSLRVARDATPGNYSLQGVFGQGKVEDLPIQVEVQRNRDSSQGTGRSGRQQSSDREQRQRDARTRSTDERDNSRSRTDRTQTDQRADDRRTRGSDRGVPSRGDRESQRTDSSQTQAQFKISPAGQREIQFTDSRFRSMSEVRVLAGGRASRAVSAKVERTRSGVNIQLFASEDAKLQDYVLQGRINRRWVTLPVQLSVDSLPRDFQREGDLVEYRHREVITLPDGTRVVVGGEKPQSGDDEPFVPTPVITAWSPTKFADIGDTITLEGTNLSDDLVVRIGETTLTVVARTATQITVQVPDDSDDCPPGALRVLRSSGSLIRSCEPHFFVRGDKPFHHVVNSTSHDYINSYLMARLSRWVYNDYFGVSSWNSFKSEFSDHVATMGITDVDFIKPSSGPGDTELAIVANPAMIVVVFRGSESPISEENGFEDWFHTNTDDDQKPVNSWQQGAWVHEGFYNAYNDAHGTLVGKLTSMRNNGQPIFLTGHSLGGALATMAAYRLKDEGFPIRAVYTYGSPRVGNSEWVKAYDNANLLQRTQRWVNRQDFAPRFPPFSQWRHVGRTNNIHMNGSVKLNDTEVSAVLKPSTSDHNMDTYCAEILQELSVSQKNKIEDAAQ